MGGILQRAAHKHRRPPNDSNDLYYELSRVVYAHSINRFARRIVNAQTIVDDLSELLLPIIDEADKAGLVPEWDELCNLLALFEYISMDCNAESIAESIAKNPQLPHGHLQAVESLQGLLRF